MIRLLMLSPFLMAACAHTCDPPPDPPIWALATVPDGATLEQMAVYAAAELAQREAFEDRLISQIWKCNR